MGDVTLPGRGGQDETSVELLWITGELASLIYGTILRGDAEAIPDGERSSAREKLGDVVGRMAPHFPFGTGSTSQNVKASD